MTPSLDPALDLALELPFISDMSYDGRYVISEDVVSTRAKSKTRDRTRRSKPPGMAERNATHYRAEPAVMSEWVTVAANGRVVIPIAFRRVLGVEQGGPLLFKLEEGAIKIMSRDQAIRSVQDMVAKYIKPGQSLVDDLIAERRAEARRENEDR